MSQPLSSHTTTTPPATPMGARSGVATPVADAVWINAVLEETRRQRNSAEDEKLRLAERLNALMNALPAAVLVLDGRGTVTECNPAAEQLLQLPLRGRLWRELIRELFPVQAPVADALQLRNGRLVTLSTRPLGSEPGQVLMLHDVTDTQQLRSRLEHSRRLADMGRMAASLAHQIRTPLASAMLYVSQMQSSRLPQEKRERFVGKAMDSLKGLERLINDMLLFARDGRGERERFSPEELFSALLGEMQRQCEKSGASCSMELSNAGQMILGNRVLLKSALQNLLNNALEMGARQIRLRSTAVNDWCELSIRDDGPGIATDQQQRIFEPFVSGRPGGSGLGLAVVSAVVQSMGGKISLDSKPGQGACFTLRFPIASDFTAESTATVATAAQR